MGVDTLERNFRELQGKVLPTRMRLFTTHSISEEEQDRMVERLYPAYKKQQEEGTAGMKVARRMEELQDSVPFTSNRQLAATRVTAKYIGLRLIAATYRQAAETDRRKQVPEFCFYTDIGWAQFQIATNIDLARREGGPEQTLQSLEQRVSRGQRDIDPVAGMDQDLIGAMTTLRLAMSFGQSLILLDEDPTGKKLIDHYVRAMQSKDAAAKELNMHPAQGLRYVNLGGEMFRDLFGKLYPTALGLRPRPELKFS